MSGFTIGDVPGIALDLAIVGLASFGLISINPSVLRATQARLDATFGRIAVPPPEPVDIKAIRPESQRLMDQIPVPAIKMGPQFQGPVASARIGQPDPPDPPDEGGGGFTIGDPPSTPAAPSVTGVGTVSINAEITIDANGVVSTGPISQSNPDADPPDVSDPSDGAPTAPDDSGAGNTGIGLGEDGSNPGADAW